MLLNGAAVCCAGLCWRAGSPNAAPCFVQRCLGAGQAALQQSWHSLLENRAGKVNAALAQVKGKIALLYLQL